MLNYFILFTLFNICLVSAPNSVQFILFIVFLGFFENLLKNSDLLVPGLRHFIGEGLLFCSHSMMLEQAIYINAQNEVLFA